MGEIISVVDMNTKEMGKITEISGGHGMRMKLEDMGIREGSRIQKVSQQLMRGPVIIAHKNTQVSLGFGMARRIMVEVEVL